MDVALPFVEVVSATMSLRNELAAMRAELDANLATLKSFCTTQEAKLAERVQSGFSEAVEAETRRRMEVMGLPQFIEAVDGLLEATTTAHVNLQPLSGTSGFKKLQVGLTERCTLIREATEASCGVMSVLADVERHLQAWRRQSPQSPGEQPATPESWRGRRRSVPTAAVIAMLESLIEENASLRKTVQSLHDIPTVHVAGVTDACRSSGVPSPVPLRNRSVRRQSPNRRCDDVMPPIPSAVAPFSLQCSGSGTVVVDDSSAVEAERPSKAKMRQIVDSFLDRQKCFERTGKTCVEVLKQRARQNPKVLHQIVSTIQRETDAICHHNEVVERERESEMKDVAGMLVPQIRNTMSTLNTSSPFTFFHVSPQRKDVDGGQPASQPVVGAAQDHPANRILARRIKNSMKE